MIYILIEKKLLTDCGSSKPRKTVLRNIFITKNKKLNYNINNNGKYKEIFINILYL